MNAWKNKRASVYNQIPSSAQEGDETCGTPPTTPEILQPSPSKTPFTQKKKKKNKKKIEGLL
jgi:hypothetical protein